MCQAAQFLDLPQTRSGIMHPTRTPLPREFRDTGESPHNLTGEAIEDSVPVMAGQERKELDVRAPHWESLEGNDASKRGAWSS